MSVSPQELLKRSRIFFCITGMMSALFSVLAYTRGSTTKAIVWLTVSATLFSLLLIFRSLGLFLFRIQTKILTTVGHWLTLVFMVVFFYVIFTPYGFLMRLVQPNTLGQKKAANRVSYWITRKHAGADDQSCENPF